MNELKFTEEHEWLRLDDNGMATVGITEFAQQQLGDIVYVELPELDREVNKGEETAVVESVKAASDVKSPVSGKVVEVNERLNDEPETVNSDPRGDGWFIKLALTDTAELDGLMDEEKYNALISELS